MVYIFPNSVFDPVLVRELLQSPVQVFHLHPLYTLATALSHGAFQSSLMYPSAFPLDYPQNLFLRSNVPVIPCLSSTSSEVARAIQLAVISKIIASFLTHLYPGSDFLVCQLHRIQNAQPPSCPPEVAVVAFVPPPGIEPWSYRTATVGSKLWPPARTVCGRS